MLQASANLKEFKKVNVVKWQHDEADVILPVVLPRGDHGDGTARKMAGNTRRVWCVIVTEVQNFSDS
jgi:hypothetical protein